MRVKKISVLGCGWLGFPLAGALAGQGYEVHGSTTTPEKIALLAKNNIQPYLLDLNAQPLSLENQAFFATETLVVNVPPKRNSGNNYLQQIFNLHRILVDSAVKNVLFVSSTGVYKSSLTEITEKSALDIENAKELIEAEKIMANGENPWQTTILRFAGLFGPGRLPGSFLAGKTNLPGPDAPVNLIHLQDCIRIIQEIIKQEKWNEVFNACADEHPIREVFYTEAARKLQLPEPSFAAKTVGEMPQKLIGNMKLKSALRYEFRFPDPLNAL